jgi:large subunit ribosomal protein L6
MSRIGKKSISVPSNVSVEIGKDNVITVKGPKGTLSQKVEPAITVKLEDNQLVFDRLSEGKDERALHGLYRALVNNMVVGVTEGFKKELELFGVGFKAAHNSQILELSLGYSHSIYFQIPDEIKLHTETLKGKNPIITLTGIDKQLIGQISAKIRSLRKVEPYKGKGVRFVGEIVRRKAGKTSGKGGKK